MVRAHGHPFLPPRVSHCVRHRESLAGVQRGSPWAQAPGRRTGRWSLQTAVPPGAVRPQPCSWDGPGDAGPGDAAPGLGGVTVHSGPGLLLAGPLRAGPCPSCRCSTSNMEVQWLIIVLLFKMQPVRQTGGQKVSCPHHTHTWCPEISTWMCPSNSLYLPRTCRTLQRPDLGLPASQGLSV